MGLSGPIALILLALMWASGMQPQIIAIVSGALLLWLLFALRRCAAQKHATGALAARTRTDHPRL